jgi:hypothetical protein
MVITDLIAVISGVVTLVNIGALLLLYRQYRELSEVAIEFAGLMAVSFREEAGAVVCNPGAIMGMTIEHMDRLRRLIKW